MPGIPDQTSGFEFSRCKADLCPCNDQSATLGLCTSNVESEMISGVAAIEKETARDGGLLNLDQIFVEERRSLRCVDRCLIATPISHEAHACEAENHHSPSGGLGDRGYDRIAARNCAGCIRSIL